MNVVLPDRYIVWLTINRGCQLRCDWCYAQDTGFNTKMSNATLSKAIDLIKGLNVKDVCIIGGEPTIDPRFLGIVANLKLLGYFVSVVTNGIKFSNMDFAMGCIDAGIGSVIVSLKETSRVAYIQCTHRDAFGDVMRALENLTLCSDRYGLKFNLSVTLCGNLLKKIDDVVKIIIDSGVKRVTFDTERPVIYGMDRVEYGGLPPREVATLLADSHGKIHQLLEYGVEYSMYVTLPHCLFPYPYIETLEKEGRLASGCQIQNGSGIIIDERGELLPCNHFCRSGLGGIDECSTGEKYIEWRKKSDIIDFYQSVSAYPTPTCARCPQWEKCGAGCRINWFKFDGSDLIGQ